MTLKEQAVFAHAFCGCDTTSAFFGIGKEKVFKLLANDKNKKLAEDVKEFLRSGGSGEDLLKISQRIIKCLYGGKKTSTDDDFRFCCFQQNKKRKGFKVAKLPPSNSALKMHTLRVYYQIQQWLQPPGVENSLDPTKWGWRRLDDESLFPRYIGTGDKLIPDDLQEKVSCKCSKGCLKGCSCRKMNLKFTTFCQNCCGTACTNVDIQETDEEDDIDVQIVYDDTEHPETVFSECSEIESMDTEAEENEAEGGHAGTNPEDESSESSSDEERPRKKQPRRK